MNETRFSDLTMDEKIILIIIIGLILIGSISFAIVESGMI